MTIGVTLIRHGKTLGNLERRYVGRGDEPLADVGVKEVFLHEQKGLYPAAIKVYSSPMKRCLETAKLIYGDSEVIQIDDFRECDFGKFEGHNFSELEHDQSYRDWIDSRGSGEFSQGEDQQDFRRRCKEAFLQVVADEVKLGNTSLVIVTHGGMIMSVLDEYSVPNKEFYCWQAKNAFGYSFIFDQSNNWAMEIREL